MGTRVLEISNCWDCPNKSIEPDPDPHDWFCDNDERVICRLTGTVITQACSPHRTESDCRECKIPKDCPLDSK